jgi:hypothetical protein
MPRSVIPGNDHVAVVVNVGRIDEAACLAGVLTDAGPPDFRNRPTGRHNATLGTYGRYLPRRTVQLRGHPCLFEWTGRVLAVGSQPRYSGPRRRSRQRASRGTSTAMCCGMNAKNVRSARVVLTGRGLAAQAR